MQHENQLLDEVLRKAGIQEWDVLIVGDGSGSGWNGACGWCSILVDKLSRGRRVFYGAMNNGSVNVAETMTHIHSFGVGCEIDEKMFLSVSRELVLQ